jgi:hypothetical protein
LEPDETSKGKKWAGKVRLVLQYIYSKKQMLEDYIKIWYEQLKSEETELKDYKEVLKHLESPFGFIEGFTMEKTAK